MTLTVPQALPQTLDPLTLPLRGSRLIEASAGTGKTWTIAALMLRLVLGHDAEGQRPLRPLQPAEILVMTFTRAATRELSHRIRQRLVQAAAVFRGDTAPDAHDAFVQQLLAAYPEGEARNAAAWRLAQAAEGMDDAAVHTIDAWCQRMLREHAFDSGCLFDEELQADPQALLDQAVHDYWRRQVYPLDDTALALVLARWPGVQALHDDVRGLLELDALPPPPDTGADDSLAACLAALGAQRQARLAVLKQGWVAGAAALRDWLDNQLAQPGTPFKKTTLQARFYTPWLDTLAAWAQDPQADTLDLGRGATRLTPDGLADACKNPADLPPLPPQVDALVQLQAALAALPDRGLALRLHAAAQVSARLQQLKQQAGRFGFSDMLHRLDQALDERRQGPRAQRLRARIVAQYPVALVDEFQDTSPLQLRIFDRLYRVAHAGDDGNGSDTDPGDAHAQALLLIGDPKQSIYGFRGADIYSYLRARQATTGRHHMLGTNHRSSAALVAAVNHVFSQAEQRPGSGAFDFRPDGAPPGADSGLPFVPVAAQGRAERLVSSIGEPAALTLCLDARLARKADSLRHFAALCAERIVTLLNDPGCGFDAPGRPLQRLAPGDVAVLVRNAREAGAVRAALRQRGLASVYLSDQDSVFASAEAADLLRLLRAMAAPRDVRLARAALATGLLGLPLAELQALATQDERFDAWQARLQALHGVWQTQGVLAAVRRALQAFDLPARWLAATGAAPGPGHPAGDGERRLTNVLHLAEVLQAASAQLDGEAALLRWLAQQLQDVQEAGSRRSAADDRVLRLESDADLVQVVTVHKSKGLEYPLVFMPFAAHYREAGGHGALMLPGDDGRLQLVLAPTPAQLQQAERERLREDLRLLYVALTRARHALWVGVAALQVGRAAQCMWHASGIGRLLSGPAPRSPAELAGDVQALHGVAGIAVQTWAGPDDAASLRVAVSPLAPRGALPPLQPAAAYVARFERDWSVSSYSALVRGAGAAGPAPVANDGPGPVPMGEAGADLPGRWLRDDEARPAPAMDGAAADVGVDADANADADARAAAPAVAALAAAEPWHRFPRGALPGHFLHGLLEELAAEGFALHTRPALQQRLLQRCTQQGWGHRADDVLAWLTQVCRTPLAALGGAALHELQAPLAEMEFWYPSTGLDTATLDALCRQHLLPGHDRPALAPRALRGLLMGFADLCFQHAGRCWVLDHKSNALGADDRAYTPATMARAVLDHRYDVQAALYQLALHRLLQVRLGAGYDSARHLGGTVFLFLRGVNSASSGSFTVAAPPALLQALDALLPAPVREAR